MCSRRIRAAIGLDSSSFAAFAAFLTELCSGGLLLEKDKVFFLPWAQIAVDMGYTVRWTLIRHEEALRKVQELLVELGFFT